MHSGAEIQSTTELEADPRIDEIEFKSFRGSNPDTCFHFKITT
jgi:hypothetical protein